MRRPTPYAATSEAVARDDTDGAMTDTSSFRHEVAGMWQSVLKVASLVVGFRIYRGSYASSKPLIENARKLCPVEVPNL